MLRMKQLGSMKKSFEQITPSCFRALPKSRGRDSFKGVRFVTPLFYNHKYFVAKLEVH
jgi:hypothetical protein